MRTIALDRLDLNDLTALEMPALPANLMGEDQLIAIAARHHIGRLYGVVAAPLISDALGDFFLRYCHSCSRIIV